MKSFRLKENHQSIPNGSFIKFDLKDIGVEEWEDVCDIKKFQGKICKVTSLETYTELGNKDFEYYNVSFPGGVNLTGISGYQLTVLNNYV